MPIPGFEDEMGEYGISHMKVSVYCKHLIEKNVLKMDEEGKRKLYYVIGKENPKN